MLSYSCRQLIGLLDRGLSFGHIFGVLASLDMLTGEPRTKKHPASAQVLDYTSEPFCMSNGVIRFLISPGDRIRPKQPLARIYSAFGSTEETLHATCTGFVLGVTDHARATPGSEVVAISQTLRAGPPTRSRGRTPAW